MLGKPTALFTNPTFRENLETPLCGSAFSRDRRAPEACSMSHEDSRRRKAEAGPILRCVAVISGPREVSAEVLFRACEQGTRRGFCSADSPRPHSSLFGFRVANKMDKLASPTWMHLFAGKGRSSKLCARDVGSSASSAAATACWFCAEM